MTGLYDWNPMPHVVCIRCPECDSLARFEFAEIVKIRLAKDLEYFQQSDVFEYGFFQHPNGTRWHGAIFLHGLRGQPCDVIKILPDGYRPENWDHSQYLFRSHGLDLGAAVCGTCNYQKRHDLDWPKEAYFQIEFKGKVLWAFDRESATEIVDFVNSKTRSTKNSKWESLLRHIPKHFLQSRARDTVSKKLNRLLMS